MSAFPGSAKVKGAIIGLDAFNSPMSVIIFQYNQDTLTRTPQPQVAEGGVW